MMHREKERVSHCVVHMHRWREMKKEGSDGTVYLVPGVPSSLLGCPLPDSERDCTGCTTPAVGTKRNGHKDGYKQQ